VVAGLRVPLMAYEPSQYVPTWVEWSIMAGAFAMFGLMIAAFVKVVPVLSVWEVAEQYEEASVGQRVPAQIGASVLVPIADGGSTSGVPRSALSQRPVHESEASNAQA